MFVENFASFSNFLDFSLGIIYEEMEKNKIKYKSFETQKKIL